MPEDRTAWARPGDRWLRLLPIGLVLLWALAWGVLAGGSAGLWSLAGGVGAVVLLAATPAVLGPVVSDAPQLSLMTALTFYAAKVTILAAALVALSSATVRDSVHAPALGWGVVAGTVTWTVALVVASLRARRLVYDLSSGSA